MNWLAQNWLWIVIGVVVLAVLSQRTRYRRQAHGHSGSDGPEIPERADAAVDPVTHKAIPTAAAVTCVYQGRIYYFESAETRQRFEASPSQYAREASGRPVASDRAGQNTGGHRHGGGCC